VGDVQGERLHAGIARNGGRGAGGGVDLGRPGAQQFGDQARAQAAVRAGDQRNASGEVHDRYLPVVRWPAAAGPGICWFSPYGSVVKVSMPEKRSILSVCLSTEAMLIVSLE